MSVYFESHAKPVNTQSGKMRVLKLNEGVSFLAASEICRYRWSGDSSVFSRRSSIPLGAAVATLMCGIAPFVLSAHICMTLDDQIRNRVLCYVNVCTTRDKLVRPVLGDLSVGTHGGDPSSITRQCVWDM